METEIQAYETVNADRLGSSDILLLCDHASNRLPCAASDFIDDVSALDSHIGVDIGAAEVTRCLSDLLGSPSVLARYSRLYIDLNRDPSDFTAMRSISDGVVIRGNIDLSAEIRHRRVALFFEPYHALVDSWRASWGKRALAMVFVHSFTPTYKGYQRPWHVGILSDTDRRLSQRFLDCWRRRYADLLIGDNLPYSGKNSYSYSIHRHAASGGHLHFGLEIRQDLIDSPSKAKAWAEKIGACLRESLE